ncbi:DUF1631 domain-containing protein [Endozoicomonas sp. SM1973]|uniref:DUF1631 domain-containing protein n=1 Tax=Spartinivicinus marinus TaxID=2994442 RepID=A0A853HZ89_9GAMM|nr:DUF1631 domain-containing protein [Spartinivicinus marinus]MCX4028344.1 DUF1631 domain-containing protein [Spartinivicinus marinus]NYZ65679.1 DUF1631 domain-containing protein [Spartinivicinus marinus]
MQEDSKVVRLSSINTKSVKPATRLSAPLVKVCEHCLNQLQSCIRSLFENADDTLFEMADRAGSNTEQNIYFEAMREVRLKRKAIEMTFFEAYQQNFNELVGPPKQGSQFELDELSFDALSLVNNEDLEETVAIDTMVSKVINRDHGMQLMHLTTRIDNLLPQTINDKTNPIGPEKLCQAFVQATKKLDIDIKVKLIVFRLFEKYVLGAVDQIYSEANHLLKEAGVMPELTSRPVQSQRAPIYRRTVDGGGTAGSGQLTMDAQAAQEAFLALRDLLVAAQLSIPHNSQVSTNNLPAVSQPDLMGMLSQIQHQPAIEQLPVANQSAPQVDIKTALENLLKNYDQNKSIGQVDQDVINLVSMLFEFILDDRNLPNQFKAVISRLQIPLLKVAILDKALFSKASHPARRLLNEMASAALGCDEQDNAAQQKLYDKMVEVVQKLLQGFADDIELFNELLEDFTAFVQKEQRRASLVEQRIKDAEEGKAKTDLAKQLATQEIQKRLESHPLPDVVTELLQEGWTNVLFIAYLKAGEQSQAWQSAIATMDELIWSVQPHTNTDEKKKLLKMVPPLMRQLRDSLTEISFDPYKQRQLFKQLQSLHVQSLRQSRTPTFVAKTTAKQPDESETTVAEPVVMVTESEPQQPPPVVNEQVEVVETKEHEQPAATVANDNKVAEQPANLNEPAVSEQSLNKVASLKVGNWVEFGLNEDNKFRAKLAAFIKPADKYIFVNRTGMKVAEKTRLELALDIDHGNVTLLDDNLLFDRALESVIGNLRQMKKT